jgi:sulfoquinovosidase
MTLVKNDSLMQLRSYFLSCLLVCLLGYTQIQAQLRITQTPEELAIWLPNQTEPAIVFPLQEEWLTGAVAKEKIKERLGSFKWKDHVLRAYSSASIDSIFQPLPNLAFIHGSMQQDGRKALFQIIAEAIDAEHLKLSLGMRSHLAINRLKIRYKQPFTEHIFGGGEQFSHLNLQGHKVPMIPEENGIGRGDQPISRFTRLAGVSGNEFTSYCPIPFYMTTGGRGIVVSKGSPWYLDFSQTNRTEVATLEGKLDMEIWQKAEPLDILEAYSEVYGRFPILPDWAWGTWIGIQGGEVKVREIVQQLKQLHYPISAIWIQDWVGSRKTKYGQRLQWHWAPDEKLYPHLKQFIAEMNAEGIKVLGYINPFLSAESPWADSLMQYVIHDAEGDSICLPVGGFNAFQFDLFNPATREMLVELIHKNMVDMGFSGWMADFAEWYPSKAVSQENSWNWIARHNAYPLAWQEVNQRAVRTAADPENLVYFSRSGYLGTGKYASAFWAGDQMTNWGKNDGLPSAVTAMISSGMSGIAINHSDVGGYTNVNNPFLKIARTNKLLLQWAQVGAFSPIFRSHEGLIPDKNFQLWNVFLHESDIAYLAQVHEALRPYLKSINREAHEKGWPMVRHLWLHYPQDPNVLDLEYEYLLGRDILVIPNVQKPDEHLKGYPKLQAYFPAGEWQSLFAPHDTVNGGQWQAIVSRFSTPSAYIRSDSPWKVQLCAAMDNAYRLVFPKP